MPARFFQSAIRVVGESMSASPMSRRLAISNIAWAREPLEPYLDLIRGEGVHGVELAASLLWEEPVDASPEQRRSFRQLIADHGLQITGLHSLLFSRPELQLLAEGKGGTEVRDYLNALVDLCADLGAKYLVLGGSKNRRRGALSVDQANEKAVEILRQLGQHAADRKCYFVLEALPPPVCDFLMNLDECAELCDITRSPGIRYQ